jgi:hypothetical protein
MVISGSEITSAKLFVNNSTGKIGLVGYWDCVCFDEFAGKDKKVDKSLVDIMKGYLANKTFSRGIEMLGAEASMIFMGNTRKSVPYMMKPNRPFTRAADAGEATDTLVTKILLGTLGCLPACDRFFIDGFKAAGLSYSRLNSNFINRLLEFTHTNLPALRAEQSRIESHSGVRYPLMKLVDMYFWQLGYERDAPTPTHSRAGRPAGFCS